MRTLLLLCSLFFIFSSFEQKNQTDEQIVNTFLKEWIDSSGSKDCAIKYLNIHGNHLQEGVENFFKIFSYYGNAIKEEIIKNNGKYQIISHENNSENELVKKFNLKADDYKGVYYLVVGNQVLTSIIVQNGKIISYCVIMIHPNKSRFNIPWFINQPDHNSKE